MRNRERARPRRRILEKHEVSQWLVVVFAVLVLAGAEVGRAVETDGRQPGARSAQQATTDDTSIEDPDSDFPEAEKAARRAARERACPPPDLPRDEAIDRVHRRVYRTVCSTAFWFDSWFGQPRLDEEREATFGRLFTGATWNELEGVEEEVSLRANVALPTAERRFRLLLGRGRTDDLVSDTLETVQPAAEPIRSGPADALGLPEDDEWLVGFGYSRPGRFGGKVSFDLGADLGFPVEPYARVRYRHNLRLAERSLVRWRQTVFWEGDRGFGTTSRFDWERLLGRDRLLRTRAVGRLSEADQGMDWYLETTLFTRLGGRYALAYQLAGDGETEAPITVERWVARTLFRRPLHREWLFLDVRPGVAWTRREGESQRRAEPVLTLGVELLFGDPNR